ncbi:Xanthine dehydrogenase C subunit [Trema orientale]|uniref:Xanthine dehydrogenase C subunit n=1 Tax=Trema orientale TaxID=63057 RepID=A0A2P5CZI7_TREOI|nr:Xanthine dehydrogenase C subunit [Trema orientale]
MSHSRSMFIASSTPQSNRYPLPSYVHVFTIFTRIAEKSKDLDFPAGVCHIVGVGGHFSGGSYGDLMRKYGLAVDNIIDAQLVNADGKLLDRESMGEDLFWAIRGGGAASFGVVLAWKIRLLPVPSSPRISFCKS